MRYTPFFPSLAGLVLVLVIVPTRLGAQDTTAAKAKPTVDPIALCCVVVRVDARAALVTARETPSGYTFQFRVPDRRLLASIKVGLKVWVDFAAQTVYVNVKEQVRPEKPCCAIVSPPAPPQGGLTVRPRLPTDSREVSP